MSESKRNNLGRGLAALLGDEDEEDLSSLDQVRTTRQVSVAQLEPNPFQPRRAFDEEALEALAESIRANGLLQPLLVRRRPDDPNMYQIIAGERRWRAAQRAQLHEVPVAVREFTDRQSLEIAIVENVQRQDLNPLEESEGYRRLIEEFRHSQEDLARIVGKSRSHIANMLRLLQLPDAVKRLLQAGAISAGHARALLSAEDVEGLARQVAEQGLSVRQTETLARRVKTAARGQDGEAEDAGAPPRAGGARGNGAKDADTRALEDDLSALLGLKVEIDLRGRGGTLRIHYQTLEQLDDVLNRLNQTPATSGHG